MIGYRSFTPIPKSTSDNKAPNTPKVNKLTILREGNGSCSSIGSMQIQLDDKLNPAEKTGYTLKVVNGAFDSSAIPDKIIIPIDYSIYGSTFWFTFHDNKNYPMRFTLRIIAVSAGNIEREPFYPKVDHPGRKPG